MEDSTNKFLEKVENMNTGEITTRFKTSFIITCGFLLIPTGFILFVIDSLYLRILGVVLIISAPGFLLYPLIRFLFFGGKDSIAVVSATVVAEQVLLGALVASSTKNKDKK